MSVAGYKSIRTLEDFPLRPLNVLIGPNGAGKSNFISIFRLLRAIVQQDLQHRIATEEGGADACLFMGPKATPAFSARFWFGRNGYEITLAINPNNLFTFTAETMLFRGDSGLTMDPTGATGLPESRLRDRKDDTGIRGAKRGVPHYVYESIANWVVYHFHDTSTLSAVRMPSALSYDLILRADGANLASVLYNLKQRWPVDYERIRAAVRLIAPFFDDFILEPQQPPVNVLPLQWRQKGVDYPFRATQLSDGTLRFICLATALLQPLRPSTILFDEPELGLHPYALAVLGNLLKQSAQTSMQIIISTQSALLLNELEPEDIIVVNRVNGASTFERLSADQLSEWLGDYTLGELWQSNVFGGRPEPLRK